MNHHKNFKNHENLDPNYTTNEKVIKTSIGEIKINKKK